VKCSLTLPLITSAKISLEKGFLSPLPCQLNSLARSSVRTRCIIFLITSSGPKPPSLDRYCTCKVLFINITCLAIGLLDSYWSNTSLSVQIFCVMTTKLYIEYSSFAPSCIKLNKEPEQWERDLEKVICVMLIKQKRLIVMQINSHSLQRSVFVCTTLPRIL